MVTATLLKIPAEGFTHTALCLSSGSQPVRGDICEFARKGGQVESWNFILERFKEICRRLKRQRRYLKIKPGAAPQEFKSPCKQAVKARFNWR